MKIYGKNVSKEKLLDKDRINKIYLDNNFKDKEILSLINKRNIKVKYLTSKELDIISDNNLHQGIILEIDDVKTYTIDDILNIDKEYPLVVILDHIEDPHNFGAIIRTSEALGVDAIIIPNDRSVNIDGVVSKTSAGALFNIKIVRVANLNVAIKKLKDNDYWVVGTHMSGEVYYNIDYNMKTCLIIGNEGKGMSNVVRNNCDYIATIPMTGKVNSLNASVSCGIILSEIVRQRNI